MRIGDIVKFKDSSLSLLKVTHGSTGFVVKEGVDYITIQWMHNNARMLYYVGSYAYCALEKIS